MDEDDKFACCHTCTGRGSSDCENCEEADLYEFDEEAASLAMEAA